jgi:hypothetical protein
MNRNRRQNTNFAVGGGTSSLGLAQPGEVDRDELRDAALGQKRVPVVSAILSTRLQKRSTLASSSGASTLSRRQTGAGFFGKSAKAKTDRNIPDAPTR